jgi:hypothetical protein
LRRNGEKVKHNDEIHAEDKESIDGSIILEEKSNRQQQQKPNAGTNLSEDSANRGSPADLEEWSMIFVFSFQSRS